VLVTSPGAVYHHGVGALSLADLRSPRQVPEKAISKENMTSKEIAAAILTCCIAHNLNIRRVMIWPSLSFGWDATFDADPALISPYMAKFENIVREFREMFDLVAPE
jgi:hypothetical protein